MSNTDTINYDQFYQNLALLVSAKTNYIDIIAQQVDGLDNWATDFEQRLSNHPEVLEKLRADGLSAQKFIEDIQIKKEKPKPVATHRSTSTSRSTSSSQSLSKRSNDDDDDTYRRPSSSSSYETGVSVFDMMDTISSIITSSFNDTSSSVSDISFGGGDFGGGGAGGDYYKPNAQVAIKPYTKRLIL